MASIALYRKYRPQRFEDVLGQEHVTDNLRAALREGRLSHAYLFSGSRGTGKTTTARILAKALNCEQGPTPEPCNTCDACVSVGSGSSLDVIEIDAASHGGVDDVRELRDNAVLAPASARKKVYIVDEAHMVSTAGWNAFLKTVEEPPEHVVFVFATTEPHKVLPTILSRCQRFDFRRVSSTTIAEHLARIAKDEGIDAEEGALQLIARAAEGGVRDAMSTLDQLAGAGAVTTADAARLLGAAGGDSLFEFTESLAAADTAAGVSLIQRMVESGQDLRVFARGMLDHLRALVITKQVTDPGDLIDANEETRARYASQADAIGAGKLTHLIRLFVDALTDMRDGTSPRLALELATVRGTMPEADDTAVAAVARIERLERLLEVRDGAPAPAAAAPAASTSAAAVEPAPPAEDAATTPRARAKSAPKRSTKRAKEPAVVEDEAPAPVAATGTTPDLDVEKVRRSWQVVLEGVRKRSRSLHALLADASVGGYAEQTLTLEARFPFHAEQLMHAKHASVIASVVNEVLGASPTVRAVVREGAASAPEPTPAASADDADALDIVKAGFGDGVVEE